MTGTYVGLVVIGCLAFVGFLASLRRAVLFENEPPRWWLLEVLASFLVCSFALGWGLWGLNL